MSILSGQTATVNLIKPSNNEVAKKNFSVSVIGILRGVDADFFPEIMEEAFSAGLVALEVTLNTREAERIVAQNRQKVPAGRYLGIGTVCNLEEAKRAVASGAMFLVTPNLDVRVIEYACSLEVPIVAGALTPTEVYTAWSAGADMIKIFPCQALGGPRYISELRGPFDTLPLVAVGGVTLDNLDAYFAAGASGVGVSSSLFGKQALQKKDAAALGRNVKKFIDHCRPA